MARKVVFYAQEEAQKFGDGHVSTEHLLLGLVRESDNVACRVLEKFGVSANRVRVEVEKQIPRGDVRPSQDMTLTPLAKRTIDLAYLEAQDLDNGYIGTEHLLLCLLREGNGLAGRVLAKLGVELPDARRVTMEMQKGDAGENASPARKPPAPPADPWDRFENDCRQAVVRAGEKALSRGQASISPEHVLLGLLASPGSVACRALAALDLDLDALRAETERRTRRDDGLKPPETFLSPATNQAILLAYKEQTRMGAEETGTGHLLLGLLRERDGVAGRVLEESGVEPERLRVAIRSLATEP